MLIENRNWYQSQQRLVKKAKKIAEGSHQDDTEIYLDQSDILCCSDEVTSNCKICNYEEL